MKIKILILAGAAALATPTLAAAGPGHDTAKKTAPAPLSDLEQGEVLHRHHVNVMEIEMGKLAEKKGTAAVKKYAAMLVADHTNADKNLRALARTKAVKLTDMPASDDAAEQAAHQQGMDLMTKLEGLDGAAFDREYLAAMVQGHTDELTRVNDAIPQVSDAKVKAMLEKTTTSLQKHADAARALQAGTSATKQPETTAPATTPKNPTSKYAK